MYIIAKRYSFHNIQASMMRNQTCTVNNNQKDNEATHDELIETVQHNKHGFFEHGVSQSFTEFSLPE